jgi:hypothetical protein
MCNLSVTLNLFHTPLGQPLHQHFKLFVLEVHPVDQAAAARSKTGHKGEQLTGSLLRLFLVTEFASSGDQTDQHIRAEKLEEGLDILTGLWTEKPFAYNGKHYQNDKIKFRPTTLQTLRIPGWVGGYWPNKLPLRRVALWDGAFPLKHGGAMLSKEFYALKSVID